jgi:hypothetical protein
MKPSCTFTNVIDVRIVADYVSYLREFVSIRELSSGVQSFKLSGSL